MMGTNWGPPLPQLHGSDADPASNVIHSLHAPVLCSNNGNSALKSPAHCSLADPGLLNNQAAVGLHWNGVASVDLNRIADIVLHSEQLEGQDVCSHSTPY